MTPSNSFKSPEQDKQDMEEGKSNSSQDPRETTVISPKSPQAPCGKGDVGNLVKAPDANGVHGEITLNTKPTPEGDGNNIIVDGTSEQETGERISPRNLQESYVTLHGPYVTVSGDSTAIADNTSEKEAGIKDDRVSPSQLHDSSITPRRQIVVLSQVDKNGGEELAVLTLGDGDDDDDYDDVDLGETYMGEKIPSESEKESGADKKEVYHSSDPSQPVFSVEESKDLELYESPVEEEPTSTRCGLHSDLSEEGKAGGCGDSGVIASCISVDGDLVLSETSLGKGVCSDNDDVISVDENGIFANPQSPQLKTSTKNKADSNGDPLPITFSLDEGKNFDLCKISVGELAASEKGGNSGDEHRVFTSSPTLQLNESVVGDVCGASESNNMVPKPSDIQGNTHRALRESSFPVDHESRALAEESSKHCGENVSSECVVSPHGVVDSVIHDIIQQVAAVNCHWSNSEESFVEVSRTKREISSGLEIGHFEDKQESCPGRNNELYHALQKDLTMSNNSWPPDDQSSSPTGQDHVDQISNVMVSIPVENSPLGVNPVDHASPGENDDDNDDDDDDDDDANDEDLQEKQISSLVDPEKKALSNTVSPSCFHEECDVVEDNSSKQYFGKLNESEIHLLKNALGEVLKTQGDKQSLNNNDSYSSQSLGNNTLSHYSSATENSSNSLPLSGSSEINAAEFDFASIIPRCQGFVISATDRTEANAQALLTHIISGDPDPCLGPDGFIPLLNKVTENTSEAGSESVSSKAVEQNVDERDVTLHNTALTGNDLMPVFGQRIVHNTREESYMRRLSGLCCEEQSGGVGEKKQTLDEEACIVDCFQATRDSSSFVGGDKEDEGCYHEKDENNKGTWTMDEIGNANAETENPNCVGIEEKNDLGYVENENVKEQPSSSLDLNYKPNLNQVSEEDLIKYEHSNIIYNVMNSREPGLVDGKSEARLMINEDDLSPSLPGIEKQNVNLPQGPKNECEECNHGYGPQPGQDGLYREVNAPLVMHESSPENANVVTGSICPCNSEIYNTDASKYVLKISSIFRDKGNAALTPEAKPFNPLGSKDQENSNSRFNRSEYKDTLPRKTTNQNQTVIKKGAPLLTKSTFEKTKLFPEIEKKQLTRNKSDRFPKKPSVTNARRAIGSVKTMASSPRTPQQTVGHPSSMTPKAPHCPETTSFKKTKAASTKRVQGQTFDQGFPVPPPLPETMGKPPRITGRKQIGTVMNQSKKTINKLRPVTASPQNVNANKMKSSKLPTVSRAVDSFTLSASSSSCCTNSSFFPDVEGACNQEGGTKHRGRIKKIFLRENDSRVVPDEASSQITGLKDGHKPPFPDVFNNRSLHRPQKETTRLYAPKRHLRPGVTPSEEYHRYKMDLRLCQSLAKIKRGPPTVDCYLDPRLKPRNVRSRSSSQRGRHMNSFVVMENIKLVESRDKNFPDKASPSSLW